MEKNKIWKGVKIGITVLLLITVLGAIGGLLYKTLKPVEEVVPPIENKVALGEAVCSSAKFELYNADGSRTAVDGISFDNYNSDNYIVKENGDKVCNFIVTFDESVNVMDNELDLSVVFTIGSGNSVQDCAMRTLPFKYVFLNKFDMGLYDKYAFTGVYDGLFTSLSFITLSRAYLQYIADFNNMGYEEYIDYLYELEGEDISYMRDIKDNQLWCEFSFRENENHPFWNISIDSFVMSGVKSVEVVNE